MGKKLKAIKAKATAVRIKLTVVRQKVAIRDNSRQIKQFASAEDRNLDLALQTERVNTESNHLERIEGNRQEKVIEIGRHCRLLVAVLAPSDAHLLDCDKRNKVGWIVLRKETSSATVDEPARVQEFILYPNAKLAIRSNGNMRRLSKNLHLQRDEALDDEDVDSLLRALRQLGGFVPNAKAQGNKGL